MIRRGKKAGREGVCRGVCTASAAIPGPRQRCIISVPPHTNPIPSQPTAAEFEQQKEALCTALRVRTEVLMARHPSPPAEGPDPAAEALQELQKWVDTAAEPEYARLRAGALARKGRLALAVRALDKALADGKAKDQGRALSEERAALLGRLGWDLWRDWAAAKLFTHFPAKYPLF